MSEWRGTTTWSLQCQKCRRFFDWAEKLSVVNDEAAHWDLLTEQWCGPVERVELRSE